YLISLGLCCSEDIIDFGCHKDAFFKIVKLWREERVRFKYHDIVCTSNTMCAETNTCDLKNDIDEMNLIGVIPWKLYAMSLHLFRKDPEYLNRCWPTIKIAVDACN